MCAEQEVRWIAAFPAGIEQVEGLLGVQRGARDAWASGTSHLLQVCYYLVLPRPSYDGAACFCKT